jgi:hypothetical protein
VGLARGDERTIDRRNVFLPTHKIRSYLQRRGVPGEGAVWMAADEDDEGDVDDLNLSVRPEEAIHLEKLRLLMERYKWKSLAQSAKFCTWDGMCADILELFFSGLMSARAIRVLRSSPLAEITHESFGLKDWAEYLRSALHFESIGTHCYYFGFSFVFIDRILSFCCFILSLSLAFLISQTCMVRLAMALHYERSLINRFHTRCLVASQTRLFR